MEEEEETSYDRHAIPELISVRMHIVQPSVGRTFPLLLPSYLVFDHLLLPLPGFLFARAQHDQETHGKWRKKMVSRPKTEEEENIGSSGDQPLG